MTLEVSPAQDPAGFARHVKQLPAADLDRLLRGSDRQSILDGIFLRMPDVFRADRAGELETVVHWHVRNGTDGADEVYEVRIAGGTCETSRPTRQPRLTLRLDVVDFVRMTTGNANAKLLFLRGRLKARGDLGLTNRFPSLFDVPVA
jgi:hypothetical protein